VQVGGRTRRISGPARAGLVLVLVVLGFAGAPWHVPRASAHANVLAADPPPDAVLRTAPAHVTLTFSEPIAAALSAIEVLDASGQRVDRDDSAADGGDADRLVVSLRTLPAGTYTVLWHNVSSADGHALRGTYVFSVGERPAGASPSPAVAPPLFPSPPEPIVRALTLAGALLAFGAVLFHLAVGAQAGGASAAAIERRTRRLAIAGLGVFVAASVVHPLVEAAAIAGVSREPVLTLLRSVLMDTRWGQLWLARMAFLVASGAALVGWRVGHEPAERPLRALGALAAAMVAMSLASHGAATPNVAIPAAVSDILHLLAAAAWAGGLVALAGALAIARGVADVEERGATVSGLAARFSAVAVLAVGVVALTGLYGAWAQIITRAGLDTAYGRVVIAKAAAFVVLLVLGAIAWLALRLRPGADGRGVGWIDRSVRAGMALIALLVIATGALTSMEPGREAVARAASSAGLRLRQQAGITLFSVTVQPGTTGVNRVTIDLADPRGRPASDVLSVSLGVQFLDADVPMAMFAPQPLEPGRYVADGVPLSLAGRWQVEVGVSRADGADARAGWRVDVAPPGVAARARLAPPSTAGHLLWGLELIAIGALAIGVTLAWWRRTRFSAAGIGVGAAAVFLGWVLAMANVFDALAVGGPAPVATVAAGPRNPIPATPESVAIGAPLYQANCAQCHGPDARGVGDPIPGQLLPGNIQIHFGHKSDGDLFESIRNGSARGKSPAFADRLTDEQIWNVVNYLRSLAETPAGR